MCPSLTPTNYNIDILHRNLLTITFLNTQIVIPINVVMQFTKLPINEFTFIQETQIINLSIAKQYIRFHIPFQVTTTFPSI